ncbi:hypothetical protein Tco_1419313 [Tanacetum coccineum]
MVPKAELMRSGLVSLTTARPVNIAQPRTIMNSARPMANVFNKAHSTIRRPFNNKTLTKNSNFNQKVNTDRPKLVLNAVKGNHVNVVKALACWVWKLKIKVIDHVSKHNSASITLKKFDYIDAQGNMSYLTDFEEINRGYVAFGGSKPKIKRYIDTKPNNELIHYCLQNPPYTYQWTGKTVPVAKGSSEITIERYMENYKNVSQDIRDQLNAKAEAVKQGETIQCSRSETNMYWTYGKFTSRDGESLESYYSRFYKMMNELVRNQCDVTNHQVNVQFLLQLQPKWQRSQQATRNRGKAIVNSSALIYDQEPVTKIYKPTNNNLRTSSNTSRANQDNYPRINKGTGYDNQRHLSRECQKPKRVKDAAYHKETMLLCKQEEVGIQEVTPDPVDNSGPIFDAELLHKVQNNNDNYNVFAIENEHPEQPESVNDIYLEEQGDINITIDSLDICYDREQDDQDDTDELDQERDLLASLIENLKCEIDDSKNRNKFFETSNKALVDKLKGAIEDFKTKNKSLESSNNHSKEARQ